MRYDPKKHHRRSIRLPFYDYGQNGMYFVTICVQKNVDVFGEVVEGEMHLNAYGDLVEALWRGLPERFSSVKLDQYIIMPNHLHGIIVIEHVDGATERMPAKEECTRIKLGEIIRSFKVLATLRLHAMGLTTFAWHRNYYEHVIRNQDDLDRTRTYIINNPQSHWCKREGIEPE